MTSIDPISGIGDGVPAHRVQPIHAASTQAAEHINPYEPVELDENRMGRDAEYYHASLDHILYQARLSYSQHHVESARALYEQFFHYETLYAIQMHEGRLYGVNPNYIPAMMEMAWVLYRHDKVQTAEKFLDLELARTLESLTENRQPEFTPVRHEIRQLQTDRRLPDLDAPKREVPIRPDLLTQLATRVADAGETSAAVNLMAHAQLRYLWDAYAVKAMVETTAPNMMNTPTMSPDPLNQATAALVGSYLAPSVPVSSPPVDKGARTVKTESGEWRDVDKVFAVNEDPNEEAQREKRQDQAMRRHKKRFPRKPPPTITF